MSPIPTPSKHKVLSTSWMSALGAPLPSRVSKFSLPQSTGLNPTEPHSSENSHTLASVPTSTQIPSVLSLRPPKKPEPTLPPSEPALPSPASSEPQTNVRSLPLPEQEPQDPKNAAPVPLQGQNPQIARKDAPLEEKHSLATKKSRTLRPTPPSFSKNLEQRRVEKFIFDKIQTVPKDTPFPQLLQFAGALHRASHQDPLTQQDLTLLGNHPEASKFAIGHGVSQVQLENAKKDVHSLESFTAKAQRSLVEAGWTPEQHHTGAYHNPHVNTLISHLEARRKEQGIAPASTLDQALQRAPQSKEQAISL